MDLGEKQESVQGKFNPFSFLLRFLLGSAAGFYYFLVPVYMWIKDKIFPKNWDL